MKICGTCKKEKSLDEFSTKRGKPQYNCKVCHSEYRKNHYARNKLKYIAKAAHNTEKYKRQYLEWLAKQKCADCGISDIRVLEQDHLENKEFNISTKIGNVSLKTLMIELNKCETVCANCHRIRTCERAGWMKSHYAALVK